MIVYWIAIRLVEGANLSPLETQESHCIMKYCQLRYLTSVSLALVLLSLFGTASAWPTAPEAAVAARPVLQWHQGQCYRYAMPPGWRATDSTNGVDMKSPDGSTTAFSVLLRGTRGSTTPQGFINWMLPRSGYSNIRCLGVRSERNIPTVGGAYFVVQRFDLTFIFRGQVQHGQIISKVSNAWGQWDGIMEGFHTAPANWERYKYWAPALLKSITVTNMGHVAQNDRLMPARNIPFDYIYGDYQKSWELRGLSQDRISQARREATMGYERMKDPTSGLLYNMPLETYDGAAGGYRNPVRPYELLVKPATGE